MSISIGEKIKRPKGRVIYQYLGYEYIRFDGRYIKVARLRIGGTNRTTTVGMKDYRRMQPIRPPPEWL